MFAKQNCLALIYVSTPLINKTVINSKQVKHSNCTSVGFVLLKPEPENMKWQPRGAFFFFFNNNKKNCTLLKTIYSFIRNLLLLLLFIVFPIFPKFPQPKNTQTKAHENLKKVINYGLKWRCLRDLTVFNFTNAFNLIKLEERNLWDCYGKQSRRFLP